MSQCLVHNAAPWLGWHFDARVIFVSLSAGIVSYERHGCFPNCGSGWALQVRAANMGRRGGPKIDSSILRQVEHADLISYGLIPEFVGRLPVIVSLQVGAAMSGRVCFLCSSGC